MNRRTIAYTIGIICAIACIAVFAVTMLNMIETQAEEIRFSKEISQALTQLALVSIYGTILVSLFIITIVMLVRRYCPAPLRRPQPAPQPNQRQPRNTNTQQAPRTNNMKKLMLSLSISFAAGIAAYLTGTLCDNGTLPENMRPPIALVSIAAFLIGAVIIWYKDQPSNP